MVLLSMKPDVVIPEISFSDYILNALRSRKDRVALIHLPTGKQFTFRELENQIVRCASALFKLGIRKGDVVALCASNCAEIIILMTAVAACAGVVTTCNPTYTVDEMERQFQHSKPKLVFCIPRNVKRVHEVSATVTSIQCIHCIGELAGVASLDSLLRNETGNEIGIDVSLIHCNYAIHVIKPMLNVCVDLLPLNKVQKVWIQGGTTGSPKGVMLTHHNAVSSLEIVRTSHFFPSDCEYCCLPLFHMSGIIGGFKALTSGSKMILDNRFDLETMLSCVEKYKVTRIRAVPPMLLAIDKSRLLKRYDLSSLRGIFCGSAPLAPHLAASLSRKTGRHVSQGWGLTEVLPITINTFGVTPVESVGSVCPNTKLKVIDVVTGEELGPRQDGELCVKGPQVMKGYYKNPEATCVAIDADGWLHTGDIGHYDDDEMIYIVDRLKELIKYKGFQVAPAEIESILIAHPKVVDVAVIGKPDEEAGELAKAFIVRKDSSLTEKEVNHQLEGKLSKYKHLHGGVEFTSSIPKTASGKILRRELKQRVAKAKM